MSTVFCRFFQVFFEVFCKDFSLLFCPKITLWFYALRPLILKNALLSGTWTYYNTGYRKMSNDFHKYSDIFKSYTLDEIAIGPTCQITDCRLPQSLKTRLEELGLTRGTTVTVIKLAPLGDPMEIKVRGYSLCLRKSTAKCFVVRVINFEHA